jgi:hypothetical protein
VKNILISLHRGYGLGDAVQMSAVLRHVAKYRPDWIVDYQAEEGQHCVGRGIVASTYEYGKNPNPNKVYDAEVLICLYDTWANWGYKPTTRVSSCLHEQFDLEWDAECGRYMVNVSAPATMKARDMLRGMWEFSGMYKSAYEPRWVAVHYKGDSSPGKKNLSDEQADQICNRILEYDSVPVVLDWRNTSPLAKRDDVHTTGKFWYSREWGVSAEMQCATIRQCKAFVGIDSGPSKCASSTDTPALVIWTGHHPAQFHDPAPNTTHLVPVGYHGLEPVCNDAGVIQWFEEHYNVRTYVRDPVSEVEKWLKETLRQN